MENQLDIIKEFGTFNIIMIGGEPYFPASQCAKALGYSNPRKAVLDHCPHVIKRDGVYSTTNQYGVTTQQTVKANYIPEGDLYRLITRSKMPLAKKFEQYIFDEIIPKIRQNGSYMTPARRKELEEYVDSLIYSEERYQDYCYKHDMEYASPVTRRDRVEEIRRTLYSNNGK